MEYLNKLKNTVSGVLPGNPITKEFEIQGHSASAGQGLLWRVYNAVQRKTKQEASVFMLEKKSLDRYTKQDRDIVIDCLKKGVSQLTRLRHPKILSVFHPLEESRESLAFATEPVFASLANVLGFHDNMPYPLPADFREFSLFDVEIKYGLLQIAEGLTFLHNDVKMVHHNVCPQSVMVNKKGAWKIAGFDCCIPNTNPVEQSPYYPFKDWDPELPPVVQPHLDYLAPEHSLSLTCDTASDIFSLGVLFYAVHNRGKAVYECRDQFPTFKQNAEQLRNLKVTVLGSIPDEVRDHVKLMLNVEPSVRPDSEQLSKIPFFEDVGAMTLQYLDSLMQRDNLQKSQFFKGLPQIVAKMPKRVTIQRVLPCLMGECVNADMVPFVLPNILLVAEQTTEEEYAKYIMPALIPLLKIQEPVHVMLIFLQNMNLLLSKTSLQDNRNYVLPMLYRAMESNMPQILELCLDILPTFASLVEYASLKNAIVTRIKKVCLTTGSLAVRVQCLMCLGKLLEYMDKWYVLDEIFPILSEIPSREPAVLMSILGIYKVTMSHKKLGITKEVMANKVLPYIIPLSIDSNLNLSQFNAYMATIKEMIKKVEVEHVGKLEQLDSIKQEHKSLPFTHESAKDSLRLVPGVNSESENKGSMMDEFLTSFGISGMLGASSSATPASAATAKRDSVSNGTAGKAAASNSNVKIQGQPPKVELSLKEKERLAREQEQQHRMKSQTPIQPKSMTSGQSQGQSGSQVKDLTSTLMSTNLSQMGSQNKPMSSNYGGSAMFGGNSSMSGSAGSGLGGINSGFGTNMNSGFGGMPSSGGMGFGAAKPTQAPSKPVDLSSLDNLLPNSKQKVPINNMSAGGTNMMGGFGMQQPQGMMGGMGMVGNQGVMGNRAGIMGNQGMMGNQSMMGMGNQGMMGNMGMNQQSGSFFGQPMITSPTHQSANKAKNELDDLFG